MGKGTRGGAKKQKAPLSHAQQVESVRVQAAFRALPLVERYRIISKGTPAQQRQLAEVNSELKSLRAQAERQPSLPRRGPVSSIAIGEGLTIANRILNVGKKRRDILEAIQKRANFKG